MRTTEVIAMSKQNKKADMKQKMVRLVCLAIAGIMVFSAIAAAVMAQVF